jgi:hypothetical protein
LKYCELTDSDLQKIGRMRNLRTLYIDGNAFSTLGVKSLAGLNRLSSLSMLHVNIGPEAVDVLLSFKQLQNLSINPKNWSDADMERLHKALTLRQK